MKIIPVLCAVFTIAVVPVFSKGETTVGFAFGDGFRMSAPETVTNGIPVNRSVCITNMVSTTSRVDVAAEVVAIRYNGDCVAEIFRSAVTNILASGEQKCISFSLPPDWVPIDVDDIDVIEFSTGISLRDVSRFSANWIHANYVGATSIVDAAE